MQYKKATTQQTIREREDKIDQLLSKSVRLNEKVKQEFRMMNSNGFVFIQVMESKDELIDERHTRNNNEMRQSKLRRSLILLNQTKEKTNETLKTNDKEKIIEQVESKSERLENSIVIFVV